jgi:hypothetical protein
LNWFFLAGLWGGAKVSKDSMGLLSNWIAMTNCLFLVFCYLSSFLFFSQTLRTSIMFLLSGNFVEPKFCFWS